MNLRYILLFSFVFVFSASNILAFEHEYFYLAAEPVIRIGLTTNASSATITTTDSQLVAVRPDEPNKFLAVNRISVSARSYRPPEYEIYRFEIQNVATREETDGLMKDVR
ncbi:MAG TPA: hypothetical protein VNI60_05910, partial [Pyrinomonadaceae bacterium]|nr:hypothetical protein [Pyrinomonadaceae bacterium]